VLGGQLSYSVYLFHIIFLAVLSPGMKTLTLSVQLLIYLSTTLIFACIFYFNFERPILSARPDFQDVKEGRPAHELR
jgi:peptidoglycan/LPS O-acetylase OafA/YrhL